MIIYVLTSSYRNSGGASSQKLVKEIILKTNGFVVNFTYVPFIDYIYLILSVIAKITNGHYSSEFVFPLLFIDTNNSGPVSALISCIKSILNNLSCYIVSLLFGKLNPNAVIFEYFNPYLHKLISLRFKDVKIYSLLRSSPHCLIWSSSYAYKRSITNCLNLSDSIISASIDVYEMWNELLVSKVEYYRLPVPITSNKLLNFKHEISERFSLILICGNLGPRKGFKLLCKSLNSINHRCPVDVYIIGAQHGSSQYLESSGYYENTNMLKYKFLGYSDCFDLNVDITKTAFVFPSFSENQSRAQLEALKYNLPIFINAKSISSEFYSQYKSRYSIFVSSSELSSLINKFLNSCLDPSNSCKTLQFSSNINDFNKKISYLISLHSL